MFFVCSSRFEEIAGFLPDGVSVFFPFRSLLPSLSDSVELSSELLSHEEDNDDDEDEDDGEDDEDDEEDDEDDDEDDEDVEEDDEDDEEEVQDEVESFILSCVLLVLDLTKVTLFSFPDSTSSDSSELSSETELSSTDLKPVSGPERPSILFVSS